MRLPLLSVTVLVAGVVGCNTSPEGGTRGTKSTFKLSLPLSTPMKDIKQGDTSTFDASVERGSEFKQDVHLTVTKPEKVDVKLSKTTVKASEDTKFTITVSPAKDAPLGEHSIKITGTPDGGGEATTGEFKIKVIEHK
jgi:uncharacterized membrane protein